MESSHGTLRLYIPLSKMNCVSRFLSHRTGTDPPFRASRNLPPEQPLEEEGRTESKRPSFHLTDFREVLQVLDDFCEVRRLAELLRLHVHHHAVVEMENQQGVEVKPRCPGLGFNRDSFQKSGFHVPQKRRAEGRVSTNNRVAARFPLVPSRTSSPQVICASVSRRTIRGPPELHHARKARTRFPFKKDLSSRNGFIIVLESSPPESHADLSEYDNEKYASSGDLEKLRSAKDEGRRALVDRKIQPGGDGDQAKTEGAKHTSLWTDEEMGNKTAVMGKMEELEGIVRQVRLSSGWMDEGGRGRDEAHFVSNGDAQLDNVECGNMGSSNDQHHLIEEFQALCEALSRSLHQVLKMEAAKAERESSMKITLTPNQSRSTKRPLADPHESVFPLLSPLLNNSDRDSSSSHHNGHHKHVPTVLERGGERVFQENLELGEQDQTSRRTSEIDDLLCSGNNADRLFIHSSCHHTFDCFRFLRKITHL